MFTRDIEKLKIISPEDRKRSIPSGILTIEHHEDNKKVVTINVRNKAIGKVLFTGFLNATKSKQKSIDAKPFKVQLKFMCVVRHQDGKLELTTAVITF